MPSSLDWAEAARRFLERGGVSGAVAQSIEQLRERDPFEITTALDPEVAEAEKSESTRFLLYAIRDAVADHALTDDEVRSLIHVGRVFRIQEGDFLEHHPDEVAQLLCQELGRLLEDEQIRSDDNSLRRSRKAVVRVRSDWTVTSSRISGAGSAVVTRCSVIASRNRR